VQQLPKDVPQARAINQGAPP